MVHDSWSLSFVEIVFRKWVSEARKRFRYLLKVMAAVHNKTMQHIVHSREIKPGTQPKQVLSQIFQAQHWVQALMGCLSGDSGVRPFLSPRGGPGPKPIRKGGGESTKTHHHADFPRGTWETGVYGCHCGVSWV